ncbi:MAG: response regulator [FCB group bacterium]|jgi:HD-like signal output (HDOD) protein/ActR/RegA family two-component response regulator|nr:response regulator [FCB group bacterium]
MKRILFVDDETHVLEGLERMLFSMQGQWEMAFAPSGQEALALLKVDEFDLVVTDMRMPGMDGAALLSEVARLYPNTVRFVLTGQSDKETVFRSMGTAHQFLTKPCESKALKATIERAFIIRDVLGGTEIGRLVSQIDTLPAMPEAYSRLIQELDSPEASLTTVGRIVETDVAMTAKLLQLANSAFFGLRQRVSSAAQAVSLLGLETVKALVLMVGVFTLPPDRKLTSKLHLEGLWNHSMLVGLFAEAIGRCAGAAPQTVTDAFASGLLHDCGMLVLAQQGGPAYEAVLEANQQDPQPFHRREQAALGCTHAEVGGYLLGIWGLPDAVIEAVAFHHEPSRSPAASFCALTAVHVANALAHEASGASGLPAEAFLDLTYLDRLKLTGRLPQWREACLALHSKVEKVS